MQILKRIAELQEIQKANHPTSEKWQAAEKEISPLFKKMALIDIFSIDQKSISYLETGRGVAYSGDLIHKGKVVGKVSNDGNGGDTHLSGLFDFHKELKTASLTCCPDSCEPESNYFEYLFDMAEAV